MWLKYAFNSKVPKIIKLIFSLQWNFMFIDSIKFSDYPHTMFTIDKIFLNFICQIMSLWYSTWSSEYPNSQQKPRLSEVLTRSYLVSPLAYSLAWAPNPSALSHCTAAIYTGPLALSWRFQAHFHIRLYLPFPQPGRHLSLLAPQSLLSCLSSTVTFSESPSALPILVPDLLFLIPVTIWNIRYLLVLFYCHRNGFCVLFTAYPQNVQ